MIIERVYLKIWLKLDSNFEHQHHHNLILIDVYF